MFYHECILPNFDLVSSETMPWLFDGSMFIVTGELNDQLFGSDMMRGLLLKDKTSVMSRFDKDYLLKFRQEPWSGDKQFYNRVWTEPVTSYAKNYAKFDVSLAPIMNHMFNRVKSQLKVIEAGFYKKALIASNIGPYTIDLKHAMKNGQFTDGNALLVDEVKNHSDWAKHIKIGRAHV